MAILSERKAPVEKGCELMTVSSHSLIGIVQCARIAVFPVSQMRVHLSFQFCLAVIVLFREYHIAAIYTKNCTGAFFDE